MDNERGVNKAVTGSGSKRVVTKAVKVTLIKA